MPWIYLFFNFLLFLNILFCYELSELWGGATSISDGIFYTGESTCSKREDYAIIRITGVRGVNVAYRNSMEPTGGDRVFQNGLYKLIIFLSDFSNYHHLDVDL